jgi:hypothetical protein
MFARERVGPGGSAWIGGVADSPQAEGFALLGEIGRLGLTLVRYDSLLATARSALLGANRQTARSRFEQVPSVRD